MKESKELIMFNNILVPLDGSLIAECALSHAIAIASAFDAKLILLRVLDKNQAGEKAQLFDLVNWQINKAGAKQYLEKTGARLTGSGLQIQPAVLEGLVAESITEFAQRQGMKLIVLSSHGRSGLSQWGISSVTQKIIFSAPTSVLIIRAHQPATRELIEQQYKRIMVPLDGSRRAENVLPMVTHLARKYQSRIHMVHVVKTPEMARQMPLAREDVELSERIVSRNREEAIRYLDLVRQHSPLDGIDIQTHLLTSDNAAAALHELVDKESIDMVVLSAHGYSGYNQWPYGSMVNNFVLYSKVPLLVVQDLPAKEEQVDAEMTPREHSKL
jgi:nucleotide-binding universal stress UspA family protein